ncbi:MAG: hypothetical protein K6A76_08215 [Oribacterium sp.]|nr:hypothetical protein [Oribacterium sp.]
MGILEEKIKAKEQEKKEALGQEHLVNDIPSAGATAIYEIARDNTMKSERMSLRVYPEIKEQFIKINRVRGLSNNSALNMIMTDYVEKYQYLLEK